MWIFDVLMGRTQVLRVAGHTFSTLILNTGAPQCCVLSTLIYSLCTHEFVATFIIITFTDDTAVVDLMTDNNEKASLKEVEDLTHW